MQIQMFDSKTDKPLGLYEVPDDIIASAAKVSVWLRENNGSKLCGLRLADCILPFNIPTLGKIK